LRARQDAFGSAQLTQTVVLNLPDINTLPGRFPLKFRPWDFWIHFCRREMVKDIGEKTNQSVLEELVSLDGKYVLDAGCGGLAFTKILVELGAIVLAIDPDSVQAELNRAAPVAGIEFVETGAESIPAEDHSLDGVLNRMDSFT